MAGVRITQILMVKCGLTAEAVAAMTDREGWAYLYKKFPAKTKRKKHSAAICFTGFSAADRAALEDEARDSHLDVVGNVIMQLRYLVTGPNAGPTKIKKATDLEVVILTVDQYRNMLTTGELPD